MSINIGITEKNRLEVAKRLNHILASEYVLYTKTWKFHWNVEGKHFGSLHLFFDTQVGQLAKIIDRVAERVRALDVKTAATLTEFLEKTSIGEHPGQNPEDLGMLQMLLTDHEQIIRQLHEDSNFSLDLTDMGTNNLLCDLIEEHEKMAWMLRAFVL
jgi:starvation-inducible DNA-binding protein